MTLKYILSVVIAGTLSVQAEVIREKNYYGNQHQLSFLAFNFGHQLFIKAEGESKKQLARNLAVLSFYQWIDSRRNIELSNRGFEIVLKTKLLPLLSDYEEKNNELYLKDPLLWLNRNDPVISPLPIYTMKKSQYEREIKAFIRFLNAPVSEPKTRIRKTD